MKKMKLLLVVFALLSSQAWSGEFKEISLNFKEAETVKVLKIISDFSGKGLVLPDSSLGVTTLYLKNVPWNEALQAIAMSENLDIEITKSLIVVSRVKCTTTANCAELVKE
jgi:type II secretory pathway component HofQ